MKAAYLAWGSGSFMSLSLSLFFFFFINNNKSNTCLCVGKKLDGTDKQITKGSFQFYQQTVALRIYARIFPPLAVIAIASSRMKGRMN